MTKKRGTRKQDRGGPGRECAMKRRGQEITETRVHATVRPNSPTRCYFFSFLLPWSFFMLYLVPSPIAIASLACIIHKLLTSERLKDQALFEVDSKEVIPGQDLARICRKKIHERTMKYSPLLEKVFLFSTARAVCL